MSDFYLRLYNNFKKEFIRLYKEIINAISIYNKENKNIFSLLAIYEINTYFDFIKEKNIVYGVYYKELTYEKIKEIGIDNSYEYIMNTVHTFFSTSEYNDYYIIKNFIELLENIIKKYVIDIIDMHILNSLRNYYFNIGYIEFEIKRIKRK